MLDKKKQTTLEKYNYKFPTNKNALKSMKMHCPHCGSEQFVKDGKRKRKYLNPVQVFLCQKCKRKFSDTAVSNLHHPLWVVDIILSSFVEGERIEAIIREVMKTAKMKGLTLTISTPTVINIIKTWSELLLTIEEYFHPVLLSTVWQIDDVFQPRPHRLWWYITNVLAVDQRYWLASHVSKNRNAEASITALQQAVSRAKYNPVLIQCDGLHSHAVAIKKVLHTTRMDQKSKQKDISIVNYIERLNRTMRRGQITKGKNFTTMELLQAAANLTRIQYNFLEPHKSLKGKTPAQAAGIKLRIQSWKDLIKLASQLRDRKKRSK